MTNTERTIPRRRHITVVLDRSGSMHIVRGDTEGGLNAFIEEQAAVSARLGDPTTVTLIEFNNMVNPVYRNKPINQVEPYELHPHGSTALLDAIASAIMEIDERMVRMNDATRPEEVIVVILTDGEENSSKEHNLESVKRLITARTNAGWQFIFLGADQDAIKVGARMGVMSANSVSYHIGNTTDAFNTASHMVTRGTVTGDYGVTEEERNRLSETN